MKITQKILDKNNIDFEIDRVFGEPKDISIYFSNGYDSYTFEFLDERERGVGAREILEALNADEDAAEEFNSTFGII